MAHLPADTHRFWRNPALPHLEARAVTDGRAVCYGLHSHRTFAIGTVTGGQSSYRIRGVRRDLTAGAVVLMNPEETHACNPLQNQPWSYRMLFVDTSWLAGIQQKTDFLPYLPVYSTDPKLYRELNSLFDILFAPAASLLAKECRATNVFLDLHDRLNGNGLPLPAAHPGLARAADFITENCTRPLRLAEIAMAAGLSPFHLVRAFKARYGLTPHAYQTNRRIQFGQAELRRGRPIVEVALDAGFADQAHFQRMFKRHVAATPGQFAI
jgi:AraC-like DNA-binding protein